MADDGSRADQAARWPSPPLGGEVLRRFIDTSRFVPINDEDRRALDRLGKGVQRVRSEVE